MKIIFLSSTGGSVMGAAVSSGIISNAQIEVASDRRCGATKFAEENGIPVNIFPASSGREFSDCLLHSFGYEEDVYFISFYTRLLGGEFLNVFRNRIFNFHPSLLPAFPGMRGFEDSILQGVKYLGATVHVVDSGVDTGQQILQAIVPNNPRLSVETLRHRVFALQVCSLLQLMRWISLSRIDAIVEQEDSKLAYHFTNFSPNLDSDLHEYFVELQSNTCVA